MLNDTHASLSCSLQRPSSPPRPTHSKTPTTRRPTRATRKGMSCRVTDPREVLLPIGSQHNPGTCFLFRAVLYWRSQRASIFARCELFLGCFVSETCRRGAVECSAAVCLCALELGCVVLEVTRRRASARSEVTFLRELDPPRAVLERRWPAFEGLALVSSVELEPCVDVPERPWPCPKATK